MKAVCVYSTPVLHNTTPVMRGARPSRHAHSTPRPCPACRRGDGARAASRQAPSMPPHPAPRTSHPHARLSSASGVWGMRLCQLSSNNSCCYVRTYVRYVSITLATLPAAWRGYVLALAAAPPPSPGAALRWPAARRDPAVGRDLRPTEASADPGRAAPPQLPPCPLQQHKAPLLPPAHSRTLSYQPPTLPRKHVHVPSTRQEPRPGPANLLPCRGPAGVCMNTVYD